jgi:DNA-binding transcriptional LysR family regulator
MLATYCKQNPNLNVSIKTAVTADLVRQTFEKKLDGALIIGPAEHRELEVETVGVEELVLVTPGNGRTVPCGDTMLTFRTGCGYRRVLENFLQTKSVNQSKFLELGTIEGILGGVKEGLGFSLLPLIALGFDRNQPNFRCTRLPPPYDSAPVQFVHRRDTPFQTEMRRFIAVARIHFLASEQEAIATAPSIEPAASLQIAKQRIELDPEPLALLAPGS